MKKVELYKALLDKISECENNDFLNILKPRSIWKNIDFEKIKMLSAEHLKMLGYDVDINMFNEKTKIIAENKYFQFLNNNNSVVNRSFLDKSYCVNNNKFLHLEEFFDVVFGLVDKTTGELNQRIALYNMNYKVLYTGARINSFKNYETFLNYLISIENLPLYWQQKIEETENLQLLFDFNLVIDKNIKKLEIDTSEKDYILIRK